MRTSFISKARIIGVLSVFVFVFLGLAGSASAQVALGTCRPDLIHFDNLDDAVNGVPSGETILVCPGTYAEQVAISVSLTLQGIQSGNSGLPVIVPPPGGLKQNATGFSLGGSFLNNVAIAAQILVNPGVTVNIANIAFDATNSGLTGCTPVPIAILFQNSSGDVNGIAVKNEITPCKFGDGTPNPQGDGVAAQSNGTAITVSVENSSFHNIGLNAIEVNSPRFNPTAATLSASSNTMVGPGNTQGNGIYTSFGVTTAQSNSISNALHPGELTAYFGIIGECSTLSADSNQVSNSAIGIDVNNPTSFLCPSANNRITNNQVYDSQGNGIDICGGTTNLIQGNTISDSGRAGISLDQGCGTKNSTVLNNSINGACVGVIQGPDNTGNLIDPNNNIFNSKFLILTGTSCQ